MCQLQAWHASAFMRLWTFLVKIPVFVVIGQPRAVLLLWHIAGVGVKRSPLKRKHGGGGSVMAALARPPKRQRPITESLTSPPKARLVLPPTRLTSALLLNE